MKEHGSDSNEALMGSFTRCDGRGEKEGSRFGPDIEPLEENLLQISPSGPSMCQCD